MCDKGIVETDPTVCKLEYCIVIDRDLQNKIVNGINKLLVSLNETCFIENPKQGKYPEENRRGKNTVVICSNESTYLDGKYHNDICIFSLKEMPGCCGILISYWMVVEKRYQGLGIATFLQEIKEDIARKNGYSLMMCTVTNKNDPEIHILEKAGWELSDFFKNRRTGNTVLTYLKELK